MDDDEYDYFLTRLDTYDLLLRALYTKWAIEADDPRGSAFQMMEAMIGSMHAVAEPKDERDQKMLDRMEDHIRRFWQQVDTRLEGEGYDE